MALKELSRVYSLIDRDSLALSYADTLIARFPRKAASYVQKATARAYTDGNEAAILEILERALSAVDSTERNPLRRALGKALWYNGRYADAAAQYRLVLGEIRNDPEALWGLGLALGDGGNIAGADSAFQQALLGRSGIVELRLDYARVLLQAGRLDDASAQIEEAQLLARGDPLVVTMKGWLMAERGEWKLALASLDRAMEMAPDQRLAFGVAHQGTETLRAAGEEARAQIQSRCQGGRAARGSRCQRCPRVGFPPPQNGLRPRQDLAVLPEGNAETAHGSDGRETMNDERCLRPSRVGHALHKRIPTNKNPAEI